MTVHHITIEVTEWDQIQALERCIMSLASALEQVEDDEIVNVFRRDLASLLLLREELSDAVDCCTEPTRPN